MEELTKHTGESRNRVDAFSLKVLKELKQLLRSRFGAYILEVILFGSRAYGGYNSDSDFDLLILLDGDYDWKTEENIINEMYELTLKYEVFFDTHFLSISEIDTLRGRQPIYQNAMNKGMYA